MVPFSPKEDLSSRHREAVQGYLHALSLENCFGVSLTMKQGDSGTHLDEIMASQNFRHFMNRLNSSVYGKRFKRFGQRLNVVPVLERSSTNRLHYHLILQNPYPKDPATFTRLIESEWAKTRFGYVQSHIDEQIDHGWTDYITKSAGDGTDWGNFHWR